MPKQAFDVIPKSVIRGLLQDKPMFHEEVIPVDNTVTGYQLANYPVLKGEDYPVTVTFSKGQPEIEYTIHYESGFIVFSTPPITGFITVSYYYAQLADSELEAALNSALLRHDPVATWDEFPPEYAPFIQWLAASSGFYMLASRWATKMRLRVETVDTHDHQVAGRYFDLGRRMGDMYNEASAGIIQVHEVTRRDVRTGLLVPISEEFYGE